MKARKQKQTSSALPRTPCSPSSDYPGRIEETWRADAGWQRANEAEAKVVKLRELCDRAEDMLARAHVMLDGWQQAIDWHKDYRRDFPENVDVVAPAVSDSD